MEIIKTRMPAEMVAKDSNDFTRWIDKGSATLVGFSLFDLRSLTNLGVSISNDNSNRSGPYFHFFLELCACFCCTLFVLVCAICFYKASGRISDVFAFLKLRPATCPLGIDVFVNNSTSLVVTTSHAIRNRQTS